MGDSLSIYISGYLSMYLSIYIIIFLYINYYYIYLYLGQTSTKTSTGATQVRPRDILYSQVRLYILIGIGMIIFKNMVNGQLYIYSKNVLDNIFKSQHI